MVASLKHHIGTGHYTIAEAAWYARVPTPLMSRWLFGTKKGEAVIDPQYGHGDRTVGFLDFIQTLAIREMRIQRRIPLQKFREAIQTAKRQYDIEYPFAMKHCTYLLGDTLVIRPTPDSDEFMEASGRQRGQRLFPFAESYMDDLTYGTDSVASRYRIFQSHHSDPVKVMMDPEIRFGEPLMPSGYSASALWEAIQAEGTQERAAKAYGVPIEEVQTAYSFVINHLGRAAA
jgi:uncharacterized protein (DUF433 family)